MKVFELMNELSQMPAGAEVEFKTLMSIQEFVKDGSEMVIDGEDNYSLHKRVAEVEQAQSGTVYLYSD